MKRLAALLVIALFAFPAFCQDEVDDFMKKANDSYSSFLNEAQNDYVKFRQEINKNYAEFLRKKWEPVNLEPPVPVPIKKDNSVPPEVVPKKDRDKENETKPVVIDTVITVKDKPVVQPKPIVPIVPPPVVPKEEPNPVDNSFSFTLYGTTFTVNLDPSIKFKLDAFGQKYFADEWVRLSENTATDRLISDCLKIRSDYKLCDWFYLQTLDTLCKKIFGGECNEATLLEAFIYCQSGYKMRLATTNPNKLLMLFGSNNSIYKKSFFVSNSENFYLLNGDEKEIYIMNSSFPGEKPLSLTLPYDQKLDLNLSDPRKVTLVNYPAISVTYQSNKNLIDFYNSYPESIENNDFTTKWVFYANAPIAQCVKDKLYPELQQAIAGKSQRDAANILIDFVESFTYGYDTQIWGDDRAFFANETLYYPYSDCEDHAILYTRLVRDLMGLKTALIYYPGHIAAAVEFNETIPGSYIDYGNRRYTVCDPTIYYSGIGRTMTGMQNATATMIVLDK